ncbi:tetratricopeptide repeat protein [Bacteroides sp. OttesenSCG-928-E20]|nr:tetratricopeptide repeat protein [Bacteroides sp. OttesenSCG-928-N06]MDL2299359.1 tetratricopeptide repeat protein [Bacteroides sp. OttesenSCG-928-E20]MDL2304697.1 tetratricopeptide repeat protein [Bacteroides sp. OttesenSCG-928-D19]
MNAKTGVYLSVIILLTVIVSGCSTKKNTAGTRFYHSLTTRYNVYFNGNEAYKEGLLAMEQQNKDNYLELIPLYPIGNTSTVGAGSSNFERAIEKSQKAIRQHSIKRKPTRRPGRQYTAEYKEWLSRKEFNPFLHNAWMLLGKAQFHKGDFVDAAATFSYIMRLYEGQLAITVEAGIWLARCYTETKWYYEAEDMLGRVNNDSLPQSLMSFHRAAYGNLLLEQERLREAVPYLQSTAKNEKNKKQRARQYYLLGQVYQQLQEYEPAYQAYAKVIGMNPPYDLELSARIRQTEVPAGNKKGQTINKLQRMARNEKNKDYLDQIYYALGNVHLAQKDTTNALTEFRKGVEKSTRNGVEKGILQLRLGNLFWEMARYEEAQRAYADAIGLIDKEHPQYKELNKRSEVLDELVTYTTAIHLQDSLQHLASLSEADRIAAIEKLMEDIARREKEAQKAEELREKQEQQGEPAGGSVPVSPGINQGKAAWYFYNPQLVAQGKTEFERTWGRRKSEDNWRRKNKTVVNLDEFEAVDYDHTETSDSVAVPQLPDSVASVAVSDNEKGIEYYLNQIPLTEEAMQESNNILSEALFNLALVYKDKLEDYARSQRTFMRLVSQFPQFAQLDNVYYNLYLLYSRWNKPSEADSYKDLLIAGFPQSRYALLLSDPDFRRNAVYGKHLEDSLYADTYNAYRKNDLEKVAQNNELSAQKYPLGKHRPKFMFLHAVSRLQEGNTASFLSELKEVVQNYPENEITELAAYILKGVQDGRSLAGGSSPFGTIWERRNAEYATDSLAAGAAVSAFSAEREVPYLFILAYESGKVNENQLLYEVARYNFTSFMVKNFDLAFAQNRGISMLQIRSFINYEEAWQYFHQLYADKDMAGKLTGMRAIVISEDNYQLLMNYYSFDDYDRFYQEELAVDNMPDVNLDYVEFEEE